MGKVVKWVLGGLGILVGLGLIAAVVFWEDIQEIRGVLRYAQTFEEKRIHDNFRSLHKQYPSQTMRRSAETFELTAQKRGLPASYEWGGRTKSIAEWIRWTGTTGLIVIKDGKIGFERYYMGNKPSSRTMSMSVAKSVVSALVGIAVADGMIQSIDDPVDKYGELIFVPTTSVIITLKAFDCKSTKKIRKLSESVNWTLLETQFP